MSIFKYLSINLKNNTNYQYMFQKALMANIEGSTDAISRSYSKNFAKIGLPLHVPHKFQFGSNSFYKTLSSVLANRS